MDPQKNSKAIFREEDFTLISQKAKDKPKIRIIVSKKVAKKAVDRNRIKRLVKESLRSIGLREDLTFIIKKNIAGLKKEEVEAKIIKIFKKDDQKNR